jgi:DNA-binding CsgD family transcriptional regulator
MTAILRGLRPDEGDGSAAAPHHQVYAEIADVLDRVGRPDFYDGLSRFVARATGCDQRLVMRYAAYDRPTFVVNGFMSTEAVDLYLGGLYRLDPLQAISRTNRAPLVVNLRSMGPSAEIEEQYLAEIFKIAFIFDELAFMLPAHGGVTIAICCEKCVEPFTEADRENARAMLPLVAAVHRQHIDACFAAATRRIGQADTAGLPGAVMVLDRAGRPVFADETWRAHPGIEGIEEALAEARAGGASVLPLPDGHVVHWDELGEDFSLAPGGTLLMLERRSDGPIRVSARTAVETFCRRHDLTPREADIVRLILLGYPNSRIADVLGVSPGTVKNHRWRLYYKLDITTERELFHLFLTALLSLEDGSAP